MLRALKNAFNSPRLMAFKATCLSSACTVNIGTDDVYSAASASAGKLYLTLADVFARVPVVVGTPILAVDNAAGAFLVDADPSISLLSLKSHDGTNPVDGAVNALALGWDSDDANYYGWGRQLAPFTVDSSWNSARIELFKVTPDASTPTIDIGDAKATLTRNSAGNYTLTFKRPFSSDNVVAVATPIKTTIGHAHIESASATAVTVVVGASGTPSDTSIPFYLIVQGSDNPQYGARHKKTVRVSDRLPRIVAGHISWTAGTPSITVGTGDFTIADTGTGVLTVTFINPFLREPIVVASQNAAGNVTIDAAATESECVINAFNAAGSATDPADLHFIAIGYDDAEEYAI